MNMELRQLVYFDAVARLGGFGRAALELHVAQPAISTQIKRLEGELGVVLIERTTRRQSLTHAGRLFWARTESVLRELAAATSELDELSAVVRGQVRIGATQVLASVDLPASLSTFRRRYPAVGVSLRSGLVADLLQLMDAGDLDLVIGPLHADAAHRYRFDRLADENLVLVVPPGHRLAAPGPVRLVEAREETFVCLPPGSGLRDLLTTAADAAGFTVNIGLEAHSPANVRDLVAAGLGVAMMAESTVRGPGPVVLVRALRGAPRHPPIGIIRSARKVGTPAAKAFVDHLLNS